MEVLTRKNGDLVSWTTVAVSHERSGDEIRIGLPAGMKSTGWRCEWNGRTIDIIEPGKELIGIDLATGEIVDVKGLM